MFAVTAADAPGVELPDSTASGAWNKVATEVSNKVYERSARAVGALTILRCCKGCTVCVEEGGSVLTDRAAHPGARMLPEHIHRPTVAHNQQPLSSKPT